MTEREKIIEIIKRNGTYNGKSLSFDYYVIQPDELADALFAAGIVVDVQSLANGNCVLYVKGKGFMRLYNEQDINKMIHRAEVAERALKDRATYCATYCVMEDMDWFSLTSVAIEARAKELYKSWRRKAEKELAEEKKDE